MKRTLFFSILFFTIVAKAQNNADYDNVFTNNIFAKFSNGIPSEQEHYHISHKMFPNGSWGLDVKWWGGLNLQSEAGNVNLKTQYGDMVLTAGGNVGIGKNNPQAKLDVFGALIVGNDDNSFFYNGGADINLRASSRGSGGRALVHDGNNMLALNYDVDFTGGTKISQGVIVRNNGDAAFQGKVEAKEVKVTQSPTADFVFEDNYPLLTLEDVEKHIKEKKHLPEIASAKEMKENGVNIGEFQIQLLQKIEELTIYSIKQNKKIQELEKVVGQLLKTKKQ